MIMKKINFILGILLVGCLATKAQTNFNVNNLVIYRVGDGSTALANTAAPIFLDEYTTAGVLVQSVALPTVTASPNFRITASGSSSSEGQITRSQNGLYVLATGYNAALGTTSLSGTTSASVNRVVALIDNGKSINTTTSLSDYATGSNPRAAVSVDGSAVWCVGGASGLLYNTVGATGSSTVVSNTLTNIRTLNIFKGNLFISTSSGSVMRIGAVSGGLATTTGQTITALPGITGAAVGTTFKSPYQFLMFDLDANVVGLDVMYVVDDGGTSGTEGIWKYSLVNDVWVSNGVIDATIGYRGLTGQATGSTVNLYAVKGASSVVSVTDAGGYNVALTATPTTIIASTPTNTALRGISFAPSPTVLPLNLLSFNAALQGNNIKIWWSTVNEVNTSSFEIQKSIDGKTFFNIGDVTSKNVIDLTAYTFVDKNINSQTQYYRLKMLDKDGQFKYSEIVAVNDKQFAQKFEIYPNPASNFINVNHSAGEKNSIITITSSIGENVISKPVGLNVTTTEINISDLPKGLYILNYQSDGNKVVAKFIKQ